MRPWLSILGIGEDGLAGMTPAARSLLREAELVVGGGRHLALAADGIRGDRMRWTSPMGDTVGAILERRGRPVAVLASGDPYCFGVGATLGRHVPAAERWCIPVVSAAAIAGARLGWPAEEVVLRSVCGRPVAALAAALRPGCRLIVLSADAGSPGAVAALLTARGYGRSRMHVMEALGGPAERIRSCCAADGVPDGIGPLNLVAVECEADPGVLGVPLAGGLPDDWFEHDGQITKSEVRAVTLSALRPEPGGMLWDVGAGSGSVGIEWMLRHPSNRAVAIERRADRAARVARNAAALGVPELQVEVGEAPDRFGEAPRPDAIFLGGGVSACGLLDAARGALRPGGVMVANVVTADGEATLLSAQERHGGMLRRLGIERLERIGGMRAFRPAMTVTQWVLDTGSGAPWAGGSGA